ncbi:hypothetical protein NK6_3190 [Bradyrhizobium diazoefficiens]|uniref:Uncharacterized protein n=2 Tax=Bradyrhizobium diazoefficiens TaxID=1355477 RepID=A0A837C8T2_9BRAD|nr:hypothetical protein BJA5080_02294 [Bradyrhizobium diazoefficiens SEMIA 5080]BAR56368.1 hypothetical protein NK6_3190 [Bradyrhizobium diazoefficiens]
MRHSHCRHVESLPEKCVSSRPRRPVMPDQPRSWLQGNIGVKPAPIRLSALRADARLTARYRAPLRSREDFRINPFAAKG